MERIKSKEEHKYTSTGIKFWRHPLQMNSYRKGEGNTIISTHVSPEGSCNLSCSYCSVKKREKNYRIEKDTIKDYVSKLQTRGLKAVIFTGGGEPTLYPHFNEIVQWTKKERGLDVALITNGTLSERVEPETWDSFSWVRVSINNFKDWKTKINIPTEYLNKDCVVGSSFIYTGENQLIFNDISELTKRFDARYIRVLPDCLLEQEDLLKAHEKLETILNDLEDKRFFHQFKIHGSPNEEICHQSFFRPYLSEVEGGTVYPCDSLVLNEAIEHFGQKFKLCKAEDILDYLDRKIKPKFNPKTDCSGCVFTENVEMIGAWKRDGKDRFKEFNKELKHENFP